MNPAAAPAAVRGGIPTRPAGDEWGTQPRRWQFFLLVLASVSLHGLLSRRVFLYSDDYLFLGEAKTGSWSWDHLTLGVFHHYSPITRAINLLMVDMLPGHPMAVWLVLLTLVLCVVVASTVLMIALFGWSWLALLGSGLLGPALSLLPLETWYTAGINILPALAGSALSLAGVVSMVRGRSPWWGVAAVAGYLIAVLAWEATMLMAGYAGLWLLLFRGRVTDEFVWAVLRRTWWMWSLLVVIGGASLWNYRVNYYLPAPSAPWGDVLRALSISLFDTVVPSLLGFHDPTTPWFVVLGTTIGVLVLAGSVGFTLQWRVGAARGWVFAVAGWLVPSAALVLNRLWFWGPIVSEWIVYFFLPSMLFLVGALEAWAAPEREVASHSGSPRRHSALAATGTIAFGLAYVWSANATLQELHHFGYQGTYGPPPARYVSTFEASAAAISPDPQAFSVINSEVPPSLAAPPFFPYNRLDRVIGISDPQVQFDGVEGPYYVADESGALHPADIRWMAQQSALQGASDRLEISGVRDLRFSADGACFSTVDDSARIHWQLEQPIDGDDLVVRSLVTVDRPTRERVLVSPGQEADYAAANFDDKQWLPGSAGMLDTVTRAPIATIVIDSLTPGVRVCLRALAVGTVQPAG